VRQIAVALGPRSYTITVGAGALRRLGETVRWLDRPRVAVVSSPRVWRAHGAALGAAVGPRAFTRVLVPDGEKAKTLRTVEKVHDALLDAGFGRDGLVVAFGGGVIGDMAGFAAATYMRGIDYVQAPTTLLAMVDSAIGGKVGVNHPRAKNLLGAFHQPRGVVSDVALLATLPARQVQAGAYEMLKAGLIADRALFESLEAAPPRLAGWDPAAMLAAVGAACHVKAVIVGDDEREGGRRRLLNLGHTAGHAFEAATRYRRLTHGEAVGWGLLVAAWIAEARGRLSAGDHERIRRAVDRLGPRPEISDLGLGAVLEALGRDKKARAGRVPFILPTGIGRVEVDDAVPPAVLKAALRAVAGLR
jgi:3-dehydroquinate synthase